MNFRSTDKRDGISSYYMVYSTNVRFWLQPFNMRDAMMIGKVDT